MRRLTTEEFIVAANKVHNNAYDYTRTAYKLSSLPVTITCRKHGDFEMIANTHVSQRSGCPKCGKESMANKSRKSKEAFVKEARKVHGNKYNYNKVEYKGTHTRVIITCPKHGDFEQKPNCHISQGNGCWRCGYDRHPGRYMPWHFRTKEQKAKPGTFYVLKFTGHGEEFIKIGITAKSIRERYYGKMKGYNIEVIQEHKTTLYKAYQKEENLKKKLRVYKYEPSQLNEGHTECFTVDSLADIR